MTPMTLKAKTFLLNKIYILWGQFYYQRQGFKTFTLYLFPVPFPHNNTYSAAPILGDD